MMRGLGERARRRLKRLAADVRFSLRRCDIADALARFVYRKRKGIAYPIPPRRLRTQVGPEPRIERFLSQGERMVEDIRRCLAEVNRPLESFRSILDFGCGCGRQIRWLEGLSKTARIYGTDHFEPPIRWNQRHLPFAEFRTNRFFPPLDYADDQFDLIYAISVFTHLSGPNQPAWLDELKRVAAPGAILLITTQGQYALESFRNGIVPASADLLSRLARHGELAGAGMVFEEYEPGMNYGLAFHDRGHIEREWGKRFAVVGFIAKGMDGWQDVVLLQKAKPSDRER